MPRIRDDRRGRDAPTAGLGGFLGLARRRACAHLAALLIAAGLGELGCAGKDDMSGEATATAGETGESAATKGGGSTEGGGTTEGESTTEGGGTTEGGSTTEEESTTEGESTTGEPIPEACGCYGDCGPSLCPWVTLKCDIYDCELPPSAEPNLECVLEALRDRTPGRVGWAGDYGGTWDWSTEVAILSDGTVLHDETMDGGLCIQYGPATQDSLKEPAYFEGCLAEPDPYERFNCMRAAFADTLVVCEEVYCHPGAR